jgi:N6-L-threonylcarbamoyladenine synthase
MNRDGRRILALETSCDETAAAIVATGGCVLSSAIASQFEIHAEYGGVVPELASRAHVERLLPVVKRAMEQAGLAWPDIDAVAVGHRPGLIGSLVVGVAAAKALAWSLGVPLIGVDHVHAHLYGGQLGAQPGEEAAFPALGLVVSGGHTSLYLLRSWTLVERLGSTIDDALGEAYDKAATIMGIPFPGGPNLDRLASEPGANDRAFDLPVSRLGTESLDFSFSGLKTAVLYTVRGVPRAERARVEARKPLEMTEANRRDLAASFQRAASRAVIVKLERAMERAGAIVGSPVRSLLTGGGVTANSRLRRELQVFAADRKLRLLLPPLSYCVDNAAMIAGLAHHMLDAGLASDLSLSAAPTSGVPVWQA